MWRWLVLGRMDRALGEGAEIAELHRMKALVTVRVMSQWIGTEIPYLHRRKVPVTVRVMGRWTGAQIP